MRMEGAVVACELSEETVPQPIMRQAKHTVTWKSVVHGSGQPANTAKQEEFRVSQRSGKFDDAGICSAVACLPERHSGGGQRSVRSFVVALGGERRSLDC